MEATAPLKTQHQRFQTLLVLSFMGHTQSKPVLSECKSQEAGIMGALLEMFPQIKCTDFIVYLMNFDKYTQPLLITEYFCQAKEFSPANPCPPYQRQLLFWALFSTIQLFCFFLFFL
jgi:hypothetical protein